MKIFYNYAGKAALAGFLVLVASNAFAYGADQDDDAGKIISADVTHVNWGTLNAKDKLAADLMKFYRLSDVTPAQAQHFAEECTLNVTGIDGKVVGTFTGNFSPADIKKLTESCRKGGLKLIKVGELGESGRGGVVSEAQK